MNMLFKPDPYDNIMQALNMKPDSETPGYTTPRKDTFYAAILNIPLAPAEKDWLWNYLKHCHEETTDDNPGGWDNVPEAEAAAAGW
ncbi:MAG: hypothetical protein ACFFCW_45240 [Candidatus Hodarchaeota archaeon]